GLFVITPKMGPAFVERLPVEKFHGVGPATTAKMNRLGINTGFALREQTLAFLQQHFGKPGPYFYWIARGVDERPVRADRIRQSLGAENTFHHLAVFNNVECGKIAEIDPDVLFGRASRGRNVPYNAAQHVSLNGFFAAAPAITASQNFVL